MAGWGAACSYPSATNYAATGRTTASSLPQSIRPLPPVWVRGARMGQNVLGSVAGQQAPMRQGRDTLACYDLKTTAESLSGLRFWLVCGDDEARPIAPLDPAFEVRRDYGRPIAAPVAGNERRTLNFIIPADRTRTNGFTVQLWMDNTSLTGYRDTGRVQRLGESTHLGFDPPPSRPLVVGVIGTQVSVGGYKPAPDPGASSKVATHLQEAIPALWPLTTNDFRIVRDLGDYLYEGENTVGWLFSRTASVGLQTYLAWGLSRFIEEYNASAPQKLDFLVAVVPAGSLSGAYGVTTARWHRICLVDERHPWAALHELGHCLGLYMDTEQYDLPDGPDGRGNLIDNVPGADMGARLQDMTAFVPEAGARFTQLGGRRIGHFPFGVDPSMHDLMGNNAQHWIVPTTLADIRAALAGAPPPTRGGRLLFSGLLEHGPIPQYKVSGYRLVPESLSCRATTDQIKSPIHNTYTDYLGAFVAYDDWGDTVSIQSIRHAIPQSFRPEIAFWTQTFELPGDAIRYELRNTFTGELLFSQSLSDANLQTSLQGPAPGTVLPEAVALHWSATANGLPDGSLRSQLYFSADGLQNWIPLGSELRAPDVALSSLALPPSSQLAFQLVTSDGFRVVARQLTALTVADRAPGVIIRSPTPGATGPGDAGWTLDAHAIDPEEGLLSAGRWTSSRDGLVGTQALLEEVRLSEGAHTLTFATQDSKGHVAQATVHVTVGPDPATDLHLGPADLELSISGADPALETSGHLQRGRANLLTLTAQNQGFTNRIRLRLFVTPPTGNESLLSEQTVDAAPFARPWARFSYWPSAQGTHRFRGQIESLVQTDPNPANNIREWTYENLPPAAFGGRWVVYTGTPVVLPVRATDPDGDALSWTVTDLPAHGQLTQSGAEWTYTSATYVGPDRFQFKVSDGLRDSPAATVTLDVVRPPGYLSYPIITSYLSPAAIVGLPFEYQITADRAPTSFEASGLPGPLVLDPRTGLISGRPAAAGTYSIKLTARNAAGSGSAYLRLLVRTNSPANVYAAWAGNWGLTAGQAPKSGDFDGDGTINLIEFALGLSPTEPDQVSDVVAPAFAEDAFTVTYRQRSGGQGEVGQNYTADGLLYRIEYTADLAAGTWSSGPNFVQLVPGHRIPIGSDMEEVAVQLNPSLVARARGFLRLIVVDGP